MNGREVRRLGGLLAARLPELDLDAVPDPRARRGRWSLGQILRATLVGIMAGCNSLWETEDLTGRLSRPMRRRLDLPRRLADTTMRDALCYRRRDRRRDSAEDDLFTKSVLDPKDREKRGQFVGGLRRSLHRVVRAAARRKALTPVGLPFGVATFDGKVTAVPTINGEFVQTHHPEQGLPHGLMRTVTCALVSAAARVCIDVIPIPAHTNEMGHFQTAFASVKETYGKLFQLVTYDAGAMSEANG